MMKAIGIALTVLIMANSGLAAAPRHHSGLRAKSDCRCYTNQQGCSGDALFSGTPQKCAISGYPQSCAVYSVHGNSSIFIYDAGETVSQSVGYGDTYACVKGTNGVPGTTPRHPIGVK